MRLIRICEMITRTFIDQQHLLLAHNRQHHHHHGRRSFAVSLRIELSFWMSFFDKSTIGINPTKLLKRLAYTNERENERTITNTKRKTKQTKSEAFWTHIKARSSQLIGNSFKRGTTSPALVCLWCFLHISNIRNNRVILSFKHFVNVYFKKFVWILHISFSGIILTANLTEFRIRHTAQFFFSAIAIGRVWSVLYTVCHQVLWSE